MLGIILYVFLCLFFFHLILIISLKCVHLHYFVFHWMTILQLSITLMATELFPSFNKYKYFPCKHFCTFFSGTHMHRNLSRGYKFQLYWVLYLKVVIPIYIPASTLWTLLLVCILVNALICKSFLFSPFWSMCGGISLWVNLYFPGNTEIKHFFICLGIWTYYWTFGFLLLPIFLLDCVNFYINCVF